MVKSRFFPSFEKTLPNVDGKVFVITGTTSGTGFVAARTVAKHGGTVVMLNRKSKRAQDALENLQKQVPEGKFEWIECDLQDFASVRNAITGVKSKFNSIFCLANNAGIMATPDRATKDGYDEQMQTNHLSHFLLTQELYPLLEAEAEKNGEARIVNHSSLGRLHTPNNSLEEKYFGKNGGNLGGDKVKLMGGANFERYFQTKLANSVFTYALDEKLRVKNSKVKAICAHPGGSDTNLGDHLDFGCFTNLLLRVVTPFMMQSSEDGSAGLLKGMMDPNAKSGVMYGPANSGTKGKPVPNPPKPFENGADQINLLWKASEAATGTFDL